jgi:hypothetical protein
MASNPVITAEPVDWLTNNQPGNWRFGKQTWHYDWYGTEGASPFSG